MSAEVVSINALSADAICFVTVTISFVRNVQIEANISEIKGILFAITFSPDMRISPCAGNEHIRLVIGAATEIYPKFIAETGIVKSEAVTEIITVTYADESDLYKNLFCSFSLSFEMDFVTGREKISIPSVARNDICKEILITAKGFTRSITETAINKEFSGSAR